MRFPFAGLALLVLLLTGAPAMAASAPVAGAAKISITGDSFTVDDPHHQAVFTGHVIARNDQMTMTSDKVVAFYGEAGASSIKSFEATGHVKIVTKEQTATGERAVFDPKTYLLTLTGNVLVTTTTGQVQAAQLVVNVRKNTSVFTGGKSGGRVTGVFTSQ
jgi:lipopolysaccharide export system protein LptA